MVKINLNRFPFNYESNTITRLKTSIVGYKAVYRRNLDGDFPCICTLRIPKGAFVRWGSYEYGVVICSKLRASQAQVLQIVDLGTRGRISTAYSNNSGFEYRVGETVKPLRIFNKNPFEECTSGIHFFLTRKEVYEWADV